MGLSNNILKFLTQKAKIQRIPMTVNFELLPVCNLNCKMCYIRSSWDDVNKNGGLHSIDDWLDIAKQAKEAGTLCILLTEGEVFLYPDFKKLYIELHKMGFIITINTNASLIDENVIEWLKDYPPKCVSISLYGADNDTYEALYGAKNIFTKVDHAIQLLQKNHIAIECKTILTRFNYQDLEKCYQYTKKHQINYEVAPYSFPAVRKTCPKQYKRLTPEEVVDYTFYRNKLMSTKTQYQQEIIKYLKKYQKTKSIPGKDICGLSCSASNTSCWITWDGKMTCCALLPIPFTNPYKIGFFNAWEQLKIECDKLSLSKTCSHCNKREICAVCPASAYGETRQINGTSKHHCQMTDGLLEKMMIYCKNNNINIDDYDENGERI